jgi:hypothetical protein
VRANAQQPRLFVGMILILIFAEALGLYGLIVGLVVASTAEGHFVAVNVICSLIVARFVVVVGVGVFLFAVFWHF